MGVLVEDLLTLARLDEMRDPVREPVDLAAVAGDAVDDARATAPGRTITLAGRRRMRRCSPMPTRSARCSPTCSATRSCTRRPGTPVEIDVKRAGDDVQIDVRDHGPGLPNGDPQVLFDRFWRAEGGRERGKAGAGLGPRDRRRHRRGAPRPPARGRRAGRRRLLQRLLPGRRSGRSGRLSDGRVRPRPRRSASSRRSPSRLRARAPARRLAGEPARGLAAGRAVRDRVRQHWPP